MGKIGSVGSSNSSSVSATSGSSASSSTTKPNDNGLPPNTADTTPANQADTAAEMEMMDSFIFSFGQDILADARKDDEKMLENMKGGDED